MNMGPWFWILGCMSYSSTVFFAAYGYHAGTFTKQSRQQWDKAVRYQLFGSLPLLLARFLPGPTAIACGLSIAGTAMFCGPLYYSAATEDIRFNKAMPMGGTLMALGWAALAFA